MAGISPKLPLRRDSVDGYDLIKNYVDMVRQNLKNLVLTNPGERMMDPSFGIGLRTYLFENNSPGLYGQIAAKVQQQVAQYMPFLNVDNIEFTDSEGTFSTVNGFTPREDPLNQEFNTVQVRMFITIKPLRRRTTLDMQF